MEMKDVLSIISVISFIFIIIFTLLFLFIADSSRIFFIEFVAFLLILNLILCLIVILKYEGSWQLISSKIVISLPLVVLLFVVIFFMFAQSPWFVVDILDELVGGLFARIISFLLIPFLGFFAVINIKINSSSSLRRKIFFVISEIFLYIILLISIGFLLLVH